MADQIPFAVVAGAVENGIVSSSTFSKRHDFMERPLARSAIILFALLVVAPCEGMAQRSHGGSGSPKSIADVSVNRALYSDDSGGTVSVRS